MSNQTANQLSPKTTVITSSINLLSVLLSGIIVARLLGPVGKGQIAALLLWGTLAFDLVAWGTPDAVAYSVARRLFPTGSLFSHLRRLAVVQSIIGALTVAAIAVLSSDTQQLSTPAIALAALLVPSLIAFETRLRYQQGVPNLTRFNALRLIREAGPTLAVLALALTNRLSVPVLVGAHVIATALGAALGAKWTDQAERADSGSTKEDWHDFWSYARRSYAAVLTTKSNRSVDLLILTLVASAGSVGIYSVAASSCFSIVAITSAFGMVAFARTASPVPGKEVGVADLLQGSAWITAAFAVALFALSPILVPLVYGSEFSAAVPVIRALLPGTVAVSISRITSDMLKARGRPGTVALAQLAGAAVTASIIVATAATPLWVVAVAASTGYVLTLCIEGAALIVSTSD